MATVRPGDTFRVHCRERFDGAIVNDDPAEDVLNAPLTTAHKLSGTSVTLDGEQRHLDSQLSCRRACLHAVDYLTTFGYSPEQAYLLLGAAPIEGRFSAVVDIPASCATVHLPTAILGVAVRPSAAGPHQVDPGAEAPHAAA